MQKWIWKVNLKLYTVIAHFTVLLLVFYLIGCFDSPVYCVLMWHMTDCYSVKWNEMTWNGNLLIYYERSHGAPIKALSDSLALLGSECCVCFNQSFNNSEATYGSCLSSSPSSFIVLNDMYGKVDPPENATNIHFLVILEDWRHAVGERLQLLSCCLQF